MNSNYPKQRIHQGFMTYADALMIIADYEGKTMIQSTLMMNQKVAILDIFHSLRLIIHSEMAMLQHKYAHAEKHLKVSKLVLWLNEQDIPEFAAETVYTCLNSLLFKAESYKGYVFVNWIDNNGFDQWVQDGQPDDNTPYLGYRRRYFID